MKSSTVNISFSDDLLKKIDRVAQQESRSRSELIREAARAYIERKNRWSQLFAFSEQQVSKKNLSDRDIAEELARYRAERRKN